MEDNVQLKREEVVGNEIVQEPIYPKTNTSSVDNPQTGESLEQVLTRLWQAVNNKLERIVNSVNGRTGVVVLNSSDVGLGKVDNVSYAEIKNWVLDQIKDAFHTHRLQLFNNMEEVEAFAVTADESWADTPFFAERGRDGDNTSGSYIGYFEWHEDMIPHLQTVTKQIKTIGHTDASIIYDEQVQKGTEIIDMLGGGIAVNIRDTEQALKLHTGESKEDSGLYIDESVSKPRVFYAPGMYGVYTSRAVYAEDSTINFESKTAWGDAMKEDTTAMLFATSSIDGYHDAPNITIRYGGSRYTIGKLRWGTEDSDHPLPRFGDIVITNWQEYTWHDNSTETGYETLLQTQPELMNRECSIGVFTSVPTPDNPTADYVLSFGTVDDGEDSAHLETHTDSSLEHNDTTNALSVKVNRGLDVFQDTRKHWDPYDKENQYKGHRIKSGTINAGGGFYKVGDIVQLKVPSDIAADTVGDALNHSKILFVVTEIDETAAGGATPATAIQPLDEYLKEMASDRIPNPSRLYEELDYRYFNTVPETWIDHLIGTFDTYLIAAVEDPNLERLPNITREYVSSLPSDWETNPSHYCVLTTDANPRLIRISDLAEEKHSLLLEKPDDWDTDYTNYYTYDVQNDEYIPVPETEITPTFLRNVYFKITYPRQWNPTLAAANRYIHLIAHDGGSNNERSIFGGTNMKISISSSDIEEVEFSRDRVGIVNPTGKKEHANREDGLTVTTDRSLYTVDTGAYGAAFNFNHWGDDRINAITTNHGSMHAHGSRTVNNWSIDTTNANLGDQNYREMFGGAKNGTPNLLGVNLTKLVKEGGTDVTSDKPYTFQNMSGLRKPAKHPDFNVSDRRWMDIFLKDYMGAPDAMNTDHVDIALERLIGSNHAAYTGKMPNCAPGEFLAMRQGLSVNIGKYLEIDPIATSDANKYYDSGKINVRVGKGLGMQKGTRDLYSKPIDWSSNKNYRIFAGVNVMDGADFVNLPPYMLSDFYFEINSKPGLWEEEWYKYYIKTSDDPETYEPVGGTTAPDFSTLGVVYGRGSEWYDEYSGIGGHSNVEVDCDLNRIEVRTGYCIKIDNQNNVALDCDEKGGLKDRNYYSYYDQGKYQTQKNLTELIDTDMIYEVDPENYKGDGYSPVNHTGVYSLCFLKPAGWDLGDWKYYYHNKQYKVNGVAISDEDESAGYAVGDVVRLQTQPVTAPLTFRVTSVDGSGAVTGIQIATSDWVSLNPAGANSPTINDGASTGTGLKLTIEASNVSNKCDRITEEREFVSGEIYTEDLPPFEANHYVYPTSRNHLGLKVGRNLALDDQGYLFSNTIKHTDSVPTTAIGFSCAKDQILLQECVHTDISQTIPFIVNAEYTARTATMAELLQTDINDDLSHKAVQRMSPTNILFTSNQQYMFGDIIIDKSGDNYSLYLCVEPFFSGTDTISTFASNLRTIAKNLGAFE